MLVIQATDLADYTLIIAVAAFEQPDFLFDNRIAFEISFGSCKSIFRNYFKRTSGGASNPFRINAT
ncbi:MAG TPA: hypothetical protein VF088_19090 [Pyrinomonadaceae bacterium]